MEGEDWNGRRNRASSVIDTGVLVFYTQPMGNPQKSAETPKQSAEIPKQKHPKQRLQAKTPTGATSTGKEKSGRGGSSYRLEEVSVFDDAFLLKCGEGVFGEVGRDTEFAAEMYWVEPSAIGDVEPDENLVAG